MLRSTGILLIMVILLTPIGCWDVQDVAETAFITAIGLDASEKPDNIKVTFSMPKPSKLKNRSEQISTITQTVEAESISRAIEKLETRLSRNVRFGHLRVIVIGEKLSRKNFRGYTNFFSKNPEVALRTRIMFVKGGEAKDVFNVSPIFGRSIVSELVGLAMVGKKNALEKTGGLQDLRKDLLRSNGTVLASRIDIDKNNGTSFVEHEGGAVIREWRVIGWLNENEMKAANWFFKGSMPIIDGKIGGNHYTLSVDRSTIRITPKINGGSLRFQVEVQATGNVIEERFGQDLSIPENINRLEKLLSTIVNDQVVNAVYQSQKQFKTDYLGFGKALEIKNQQLYKKIDWPEVYPTVPVNVKVQTNVHRYGKTK